MLINNTWKFTNRSIRLGEHMGFSITLPETQTEYKVEAETPWSVVVQNDPVNLMSYVALIFRKVFGFDSERARKHMMEVHHMGQSVVWTGSREQAEHYSHILHQWQLNANIRQDVSS